MLISTVLTAEIKIGAELEHALTQGKIIGVENDGINGLYACAKNSVV